MSGIATALRRPALRSNGSHNSNKSGGETSSIASSSRSILSAHPINSIGSIGGASSSATKNSAAAPPDIRPDMLPFLKQQQLQNLCSRLGLKGTGKKADLIARLTEATASTSLSADGGSSIHTITPGKNASPSFDDSQAMSIDEADKENRGSMTIDSRDDVEMIGIPREPASIRVIHTMRDSVDNQRRDSIARDTGAGIVLPSSSTHSGSLLAGKPETSSAESSSLKSKRSAGSIATLPSVDSGKAQLRRGPSASILPRLRSVSKGVSRMVSSHSIAAKLRRPSGSSSSSSLNAITPETLASSPQRDKRKREEHDQQAAEAEPRGRGLAYATDRDGADTVEQPVRHVLSPQRPIKARPSRAIGRKGVTAVTQDMSKTAEMSAAATVPTRAFTFSMPCSPQPKTVDTASVGSTVSDDATNKVLAEMQARLARNGKGAQASTESLRARVQSGQEGQSNSPQLPPSPLKSVDGRTRGRFSSQHDKHFGQMDSIASHYAARRAAMAKADKDVQSASPSTHGSSTKSNTSTDDLHAASSAKRQRVDDDDASKKTVTFSSQPKQTATRTDKERAIVKRKLEQARERRKSGVSIAATGDRRKMQSSITTSKKGPASHQASHGAGAFAHKLGHAVRGFVSSASTMRKDKQMVAKEPAAAKEVARPTLATEASTSTTRIAKPVFDLQSRGKLNASTSKSETETKTASPIRQDWQWVPTPEKKAAPATVPFPKEAVASPLGAAPQRATPSKRAIGPPTALAARKNRSSMSQTARTTIRGGQTASRQIAAPARKVLPGQQRVPSAAPTGIARPRAVALRARRSSSTTPASSGMATARMHQRRPSGVPRLASTPSKRKRPLLIPPRTTLAAPSAVASSSTVAPARRPGVTTIVRSPRPGLPSPVRRVSGRGRGKPSVRPVAAGESDHVSNSANAGHAKVVADNGSA